MPQESNFYEHQIPGSATESLKSGALLRGSHRGISGMVHERKKVNIKSQISKFHFFFQYKQAGYSFNLLLRQKECLKRAKS